MAADWDAYTTSIDQLRDAAQAMLDDALAKCDWSTPRAAELSLEYLQGIYEYVYQIMGDAAGVLVDEWVTQLAADEGITLDKLEERLSESDNAKQYAEKMAEKSQELLNKGDVAGVVNLVKNDLDMRLSLTARNATQKATRNRKGRRKDGKRFDGIWQFAWVNQGTETCAFCRVLASRGWVYTEKDTAQFRQHVHGNCDCKLAVRPVGSKQFPFVDEEAKKQEVEYIAAKGDHNSRYAINALRRQAYADPANGDRIREQHREAYRRRQEGKELLEQWQHQEPQNQQ